MINVLITWFLSAGILLLTSTMLSGFELPGFGTALLAAAVIAVLNFMVRPIIAFFTLPINILTLGLFSFVINAIILQIADILMSGFVVDGWGTAILAAIVLSIIHVITNRILPGERKLLGR